MSSVPNEFRIKWPPKETWTDATREVQSFWGEPNSWEEGSKTNIIQIMANHPPMALAWSHFGKYFMTGHTLNNRQLEFVVLRVAVLVKSHYEWHNHVGYAMQAGITLEEIAQIDRIVYDELERGRATRDAERLLKTIINAHAQDGAQAIVLGATELELVVDIDANILPIYSSTRLHVARAADWLLGN